MDVKDILVRAAKTAVQTFISSASVLTLIGGDVPALKAAIISAGAAALSVIWNAALSWSQS